MHIHPNSSFSYLRNELISLLIEISYDGSDFSAPTVRTPVGVRIFATVDGSVSYGCPIGV